MKKENPITALDVHPVKTNYVVLGFQDGLLEIVDLKNPQEVLFTIKDQHKGSKIINVKFCDDRDSSHNGNSEDDSINSSFSLR